jgi:hypothetical protein
MNVQDQRSPRRVRRHAVVAAPNGALTDARSEAAVARPAATDVTSRAADQESMVATAAYFLAEKRGFQAGHEIDDWLAAEAAISAMKLPSTVTSGQSIGTRSAS